jgi:hypothetical protein
VLASRKNAGIRVTLLWAADTDTVAVLVCDRITKEQFELVVEPDANPIAVYEHPYAYAARRGIDYRTADLRQRGNVDMDATTLEATRYLAAIDLFHAMELDVKWRHEANEVGPLSLVPGMERPPRCKHCAGPRVRINGRHICLGPTPVARLTEDS